MRYFPAGFLFVLLAVGTAGLLSACAVLYRLPVQQGQVVSKSRLNALYKGMTESSVQATIGAPLLKDPWYPRTWVYPESVARKLPLV
jgi:outer membrane protein assembly factor BamE